MTFQDLNPNGWKTDGIIDSNLLTLYQRVKKVESLWLETGGHVFYVTSGLRSPLQQSKIIAAGKSQATKSRHLIGAAVDIHDPDSLIKDWLIANPKILEEAYLWCEAAAFTPTWWHAQIIPPASGHRWFVP